MMSHAENNYQTTQYTAAPTSVDNIRAILDALGYIESDIATKGDAEAVLVQIKFLVKNSKIRENILSSLSFLPPNMQNTARVHGLSALEDLAQVYEYYSDEFDDITGRKIPHPANQMLQFENNAVLSAKKEFAQFLSSFEPMPTISN